MSSLYFVIFGSIILALCLAMVLIIGAALPEDPEDIASSSENLLDPTNPLSPLNINNPISPLHKINPGSDFNNFNI